MKLYTIFYVVSYDRGYDAPTTYRDRILARHAEDARSRSYDRMEARLRRQGLYDPEADYLTMVAVVRGRVSGDAE